MQCKELEKQIKWLHNKLDAIYHVLMGMQEETKDSFFHEDQDRLNNLTKPKQPPHKDLCWSDTNKADELKKEFEENIPNAK